MASRPRQIRPVQINNRWMEQRFNDRLELGRRLKDWSPALPDNPAAESIDLDWFIQHSWWRGGREGFRETVSTCCVLQHRLAASRRINREWWRFLRRSWPGFLWFPPFLADCLHGSCLEFLSRVRVSSSCPKLRLFSSLFSFNCALNWRFLASYLAHLRHSSLLANIHLNNAISSCSSNKTPDWMDPSPSRAAGTASNMATMNPLNSQLVILPVPTMATWQTGKHS